MFGDGRGIGSKKPSGRVLKLGLYGKRSGSSLKYGVIRNDGIGVF
jgi:hypothetical protein